MSSITSSLHALLTSIFDLFASILNTLLSSFQSLFAIAGTLVADVLNLCQGLFEFLLSNIMIIGVLAMAFVGYTVYQGRQGRSVAGKKNA